MTADRHPSTATADVGRSELGGTKSPRRVEQPFLLAMLPRCVIESGLHAGCVWFYAATS
jgi:hypothetical protein